MEPKKDTHRYRRTLVLFLHELSDRMVHVSDFTISNREIVVAVKIK